MQAFCLVRVGGQGRQQGNAEGERSELHAQFLFRAGPVNKSARRRDPEMLLGLPLHQSHQRLPAEHEKQHGVMLDGTARLVMVPMAAASALVYAVLAFTVHKRPVPDHLAQPADRRPGPARRRPTRSSTWCWSRSRGRRPT